MAPSRQVPLGLALALSACLFVPRTASSAHPLARRSTVCYGDLGCFSTVANLHSLPMTPQEVGTTFALRVRGNPHAAAAARLRAIDDPGSWHAALAGSGFSAAKETKVITHGFLDSGSGAWPGDMATELLKRVSRFGDFFVD